MPLHQIWTFCDFPLLSSKPRRTQCGPTTKWYCEIYAAVRTAVATNRTSYSYPLSRRFWVRWLWNSCSSTVQTAPFTFSTRTKNLCKLRLCRTAFCPSYRIIHKLAQLIKSKSKVKYVDLYSASSWSTSNALPFPVSRRWSSQAIPTAKHQRHCDTTWYGLVYHAICLFTPPAYAGYSFQPRQAQAE